MELKKIFYNVKIQEKIGNDEQLIVNGIAINSCTTRNGHTFLSEELEKAAATLTGKPLLKDHNATVDHVIGRVISSRFDQISKAILFSAIVNDKEVIKRIDDGRIDSVSVGAMIKDIEHIEATDDEPERFILRGIEFIELSLVAVPADPNAGLFNQLEQSFAQVVYANYKGDYNKQEKRTVLDDEDIDVETTATGISLSINPDKLDKKKFPRLAN